MLNGAIFSLADAGEQVCHDQQLREGDGGDNGASDAAGKEHPIPLLDPMTFSWSKVSSSGNGTVSFSNPTSLQTSASFSLLSTT